MSRTAVTLPLLSDTMETGRLTRWLKQPGDPVKVGDALAEVESDKAAMDLEAFADGYLAGPVAPTDTEIPVKSTIAWIVDDPAQAKAEGSSSEALPPAAPADTGTSPSAAAHSAAGSAPVSPPPAAAATPTGPTPQPAASASCAASDTPTEVVAAALAARGDAAGGASPFAQELATELGLDLAQIRGGRGKRIGAAQVLAAALGPRSPTLNFAPDYRLERPSPLKAAMAENIARSVRTPTFHVTIAADLAPLHAAAQAQHDSFTLLLVRACALALRAHPDFNACWTSAGLARRERIDVAIAVDTPDGLITPVLRDARRPLDELAEDWRILKGKVGKRRLTPADYSGATFYISNLGQYPKVEQFDAIVPAGATAVLAVSAPGTDGLTRLTLSCDHRVVAGVDAACFLATLAEHLAEPDALMN